MKSLRFEEAMKKLEKIVADLESGNLSLEDSLKKYEEGVRLSVFCSKRLDEAEKKIQVLSKDSCGVLEAKEFQEPDAEIPAETLEKADSKTEKVHRKKKQDSSSEEDLFDE